MTSPNSSPLPSNTFSENDPFTKDLSPPPTPPTSEYTDSECEKEDSWSSQASEYSKGTSDDEYGDPEEDEPCRKRRKLSQEETPDEEDEKSSNEDSSDTVEDDDEDDEEDDDEDDDEE